MASTKKEALLLEEKKRNKLELTVDVLDLTAGEEAPKIAMYLLDSTGKVLKKVAEVKEGKLTIDAALAKEKQKILAIGPDAEKLDQLRGESLLQFRIGDQWPLWEKTRVVEIPKHWWHGWLRFRVCVSCKVVKCWPFL